MALSLSIYMFLLWFADFILADISPVIKLMVKTTHAITVKYSLKNHEKDLNSAVRSVINKEPAIEMCIIILY